jgi:hypothetical protein
MTTLTANTLSINQAAKAPAKDAAKSGFFSRLVAAQIASRQRKAEIEIRRHFALMGDLSKTPDYAMLPFRGE